MFGGTGTNGRHTFGNITSSSTYMPAVFLVRVGIFETGCLPQVSHSSLNAGGEKGSSATQCVFLGKFEFNIMNRFSKRKRVAIRVPCQLYKQPAAQEPE